MLRHPLATTTTVGHLGVCRAAGRAIRTGTAASGGAGSATDADHLASTGVTLLALLVTDHELEPHRADAYVAVLEARGVEVWREPVAELDVPASRDRFRQASSPPRATRSQAGRRVVAACGTGLGRSSTFAACVLREEGLDGGRRAGGGPR